MIRCLGTVNVLKLVQVPCEVLTLVPNTKQCTKFGTFKYPKFSTFKYFKFRNIW